MTVGSGIPGGFRTGTAHNKDQVMVSGLGFPSSPYQFGKEAKRMLMIAEDVTNSVNDGDQ